MSVASSGNGCTGCTGYCDNCTGGCTGECVGYCTLTTTGMSVSNFDETLAEDLWLVRGNSIYAGQYHNLTVIGRGILRFNDANLAYGVPVNPIDSYNEVYENVAALSTYVGRASNISNVSYIPNSSLDIITDTFDNNGFSFGNISSTNLSIFHDSTLSWTVNNVYYATLGYQNVSPPAIIPMPGNNLDLFVNHGTSCINVGPSMYPSFMIDVDIAKAGAYGHNLHTSVHLAYKYGASRTSPYKFMFTIYEWRESSNVNAVGTYRNENYAFYTRYFWHLQPDGTFLSETWGPGGHPIRATGNEVGYTTYYQNETKQLNINAGGTWTTPQEVSTNIGGTWKAIH